MDGLGSQDVGHSPLSSSALVRTTSPPRRDGLVNPSSVPLSVPSSVPSTLSPTAVNQRLASLMLPGSNDQSVLALLEGGRNEVEVIQELLKKYARKAGEISTLVTLLYYRSVYSPAVNALEQGNSSGEAGTNGSGLQAFFSRFAATETDEIAMSLANGHIEASRVEHHITALEDIWGPS